MQSLLRSAWFTRIAVISATLVIALAFAYRSTWVQDRLIASAAANGQIERTELLHLDAMYVLICGSASPLASRSRERPCVAVFAGGQYYLVDTGPGIWNNLASWRIPADQLGAVLITHLHSDHIGDLGEVNLQTWVGGRRTPLDVYGPDGVADLVDGLNQAYRNDHLYRTAHHGPEVANPALSEMVPRTIPFNDAATEHRVILEKAGLKITAFLVEHEPVTQALGFRFDYAGRSVVVSGDTKASLKVERMAQDVDVLVHEAQANHMLPFIADAAKQAGRMNRAKILNDIPSYHTTPVEAAEIANRANAKLLVLYHLTPPPSNALTERVFMRGVADVRDKAVVLSEDGTLISLPERSNTINIGHIDD